MKKVIKYTNDRSTLIVLSLLKAHGIKKVVASPGTTNIALVASMQQDPWFEMYSSVDERSAAYIACGLAGESGEPVVITCTGATASRNYFPGLTEAYYRKLPVLAITGSHGDEETGHLHPQTLDRRNQPFDSLRISVAIDRICEPKDEWSTIVKVNTALLELKHHGGGPVHINLREATRSGYDTNMLPDIRKIDRIEGTHNMPVLSARRIAIFIGAHKVFPKEVINAIEEFCEKYNAAVFCDHTSGYNGKNKVLYALPGCQTQVNMTIMADLFIHLGEVSADMYSVSKVKGKETWRVSPDGEIKDLNKNLTYVFELSELDFFTTYNSRCSEKKDTSLYKESIIQYETLLDMMPVLPWGNIWCAQQMHKKIPSNSVIHFSIYNSLRSWNFFELDDSITTNCNVGGFGIDGPLSTLIGASLASPDRLHYGIVGDLAFFYDLNSLGNRHVGNNLRILLVNNGVGTEFKNYDHPASAFGDLANLFIAAGGHYGNQSRSLVRDYSQNLGFEYLMADNKEDFTRQMDRFLIDENTAKPMLFEVFTNSQDESAAIKLMRTIAPDERTLIEKSVIKSKQLFKKIIGNIKR